VRVLLKRQWLVAIVWVAGWVAVRFMRANFGDTGAPRIVTTGVFWLLLFTVLVFIMLRLGFFALVVALFVLDSMIGAFFTTDFSAWYGQSSLDILILVGAMALWGFRLALGSRPLFSPAALEKT
jgi:hypothetical protein